MFAHCCVCGLIAATLIFIPTHLSPLCTSTQVLHCLPFPKAFCVIITWLSLVCDIALTFCLVIPLSAVLVHGSCLAVSRVYRVCFCCDSPVCYCTALTGGSSVRLPPVALFGCLSIRDLPSAFVLVDRLGTMFTAALCCLFAFELHLLMRCGRFFGNLRHTVRLFAIPVRLQCHHCVS